MFIQQVWLLFLISIAYAALSKSSKSLYTVLGVDRNADETTIKKAYRKLAMKVIVFKIESDHFSFRPAPSR